MEDDKMIETPDIDEETHQKNIAAMRRETEAYLKKIHKTIQDSKSLLGQVELRMAETDRLLEEQGLTREQLSSVSFTDEQIAAVNEELKRRGLPPLDDLPPKREATLRGGGTPPAPDPAERDATPENRKKKFGVMMQQFRM